MSPQRIQRKRTKGWRMPKGAIYVGRPTKWGNPWLVDPIKATSPASNQYRATAEECVRLYRLWAAWYVEEIRAKLAGHDLACWCPLEDEQGNRVPCHADVLLSIANGGGE